MYKYHLCNYHREHKRTEYSYQIAKAEYRTYRINARNLLWDRLFVNFANTLLYVNSKY